MVSKLGADVFSKSLTASGPGVGTRNAGIEVAVVGTAQEVMGPALLQLRADLAVTQPPSPDHTVGSATGLSSVAGCSSATALSACPWTPAIQVQPLTYEVPSELPDCHKPASGLGLGLPSAFPCCLRVVGSCSDSLGSPPVPCPSGCS